jgi:hypothetical protein
MSTYANTCPLSQRQLLDEFFMEHRTKILDLAAFLDRMDRSVEQNAGDDFRLVAFRQALAELCGDAPGRIERVQMLLSDRDTSLLDERDQQNAFGAAKRS